MPLSVDQWVPEEHLARFLWDIVESFDLSVFYDSYATEEAPPYDPQMMLAYPAVRLVHWHLFFS